MNPDQPLALFEMTDFGVETVDGYACPTDPMDLLQCDSCQ